MAEPIDSVLVVFNPGSTGNADALARELRDDLAAVRPQLPVELRPTEYAGHAREIARDAASGPGHPLVVSASGDGGYNEVVNGILDVPDTRAAAAVLAAGNANDHRRVTARRPLAEAIVGDEPERMDVLELRRGDLPPHHAHSYIGFGLTPVVALQIEKGGKGSLREVVSTVRSFWAFTPFEIEFSTGSRRRIDNLVFANIGEMAKVAEVSEDSRPDDGLFEVVLLEHRPKWRQLGIAVKAALFGLGRQPSTREFRFTACGPMPVQIDGEIDDVEAGTEVRVRCLPGALRVLR
ncbi:diacylglycerol/lipid kinase family protein [Pseudonocardia sp. HH130630-07]|uniref:diacylglycerol/lipid kinase family protein n=1 Tax=Pseudonocardia sp. HH130630-07 TaxID=1690815 RepID=UPI000814E71C|nr:diacylglycerol kinase family protein [Pseudonocardia sp. HH130630-07]ANY06301.1 diacylglycerol kinase [Pseudonocardia sp. HH130630-07]